MINRYVLSLMLFLMSFVGGDETRTYGKICNAAQTRLTYHQGGSAIPGFPEVRKNDTTAPSTTHPAIPACIAIPAIPVETEMRFTEFMNSDWNNAERETPPTIEIAMVFLTMIASVLFSTLCLRKANFRKVNRRLNFEAMKSKTECRIKDFIIKSAVEHSTGNSKTDRKTQSYAPHAAVSKSDVNSSEISTETEMCSTQSKNNDQVSIDSYYSDCNNADRETPGPIEEVNRRRNFADADANANSRKMTGDEVWIRRVLENLKILSPPHTDLESSEISVETEMRCTESKNIDQALIDGNYSDCDSAEREAPLPNEKGEDSSEISAETENCSTEFKEDEQELIVSDYSDWTPRPNEKGEDSSEISAETENCSTEFKEDEQELIVSDYSDWTRRPNEKESAINTKRLIFGNKGRDYIMKRYGVLNNASRYKMLLLCRKKAKEEGNRRFGGHLKKSAEMFTETSWNTGKVGFKDLCRLVVDRIPEDDWMEFVRMNLNLEETEIQRFRGKYCVFNKEQKRQILEGFNVY